MNQKELTKTFMMISNRKTLYLRCFFTNQLNALRANKALVLYGWSANGQYEGVHRSECFNLCCLARQYTGLFPSEQLLPFGLQIRILVNTRH